MPHLFDDKSHALLHFRKMGFRRVGEDRSIMQPNYEFSSNLPYLKTFEVFGCYYFKDCKFLNSRLKFSLSKIHFKYTKLKSSKESKLLYTLLKSFSLITLKSKFIISFLNPNLQILDPRSDLNLNYMIVSKSYWKERALLVKLFQKTKFFPKIIYLSPKNLTENSSFIFILYFSIKVLTPNVFAPTPGASASDSYSYIFVL